jgi:hypothetical protein
MSAVDFEDFCIDGLDLTLGGKTFTVEPPSTKAMGLLYALAAQTEVALKLKQGPLPAEVEAVIATIGPDEHPALGAAYERMVDAGLNPTNISRAAVYSIFYWTHGKDYATAIATFYFAKNAEKGGEDAAPKARPRSPRKSGRATASATPSASAKTASPSTPTTDSPPTASRSKRAPSAKRPPSTSAPSR